MRFQSPALHPHTLVLLFRSLNINFSIFTLFRNLNADTQVLIGDALQEQDNSLCSTTSRHHRMSNGVSALSDGHSDLSSSD